MQDYKMVVRAVYNGQTIKRDGVIHVQNAQEAQDYINENYLSKGYELLKVDFLGEVLVNELEQVHSPKALRFAWHFVKNDG